MMPSKIVIGRDAKNNKWRMIKDGRWKWEKIGIYKTVEKESVWSFDTEEECEADAKKHGMDGDFIPHGRG